MNIGLVTLVLICMHYSVPNGIYSFEDLCHLTERKPT